MKICVIVVVVVCFLNIGQLLELESHIACVSDKWCKSQYCTCIVSREMESSVPFFFLPFCCHSGKEVNTFLHHCMHPFMDLDNNNASDQEADVKGRVNWDSDQDIEDTETPSDVKAVLEAAENARLEDLTKLLDQNAELVNCRDVDGYTPLHRACYNNHLKVIDLLLTRGADLTNRTTEGWTALHSACKWGHHEAAALLLAAGADVNSMTNGRVTPLHLASTQKNRHLLELLLFRPEIDLSLKNESGETAYQVACRSGPFHCLFHLSNNSESIIE